MSHIDTDLLMLHAGTAIFSSDNSFGIVLGNLKAELSKYGTVYQISDNGDQFNTSIRENALPKTIGKADFFIDCSSILRKSYLSCKIENSTPGHYALTVKEGNSANKTTLWIIIAIQFAMIYFFWHGLATYILILSFISFDIIIEYITAKKSVKRANSLLTKFKS